MKTELQAQAESEQNRLISFGSIMLLIIVTIICATIVARTYLFTSNGYTQGTLPGDDKVHWIKSSTNCPCQTR